MCNSLRDNSILSLHMTNCDPLSTSVCLVEKPTQHLWQACGVNRTPTWNFFSNFTRIYDKLGGKKKKTWASFFGRLGNIVENAGSLNGDTTCNMTWYIGEFEFLAFEILATKACAKQQNFKIKIK